MLLFVLARKQETHSTKTFRDMISLMQIVVNIVVSWPVVSCPVVGYPWWVVQW